MDLSTLASKPKELPRLSRWQRWRTLRRARELRSKYAEYTMVLEGTYASNLELATRVASVPGCVVECGVWRGGMSAGLAEILGPERAYHLFDSFEGLPPTTTIDGKEANEWSEAARPNPADNLAVSVSFARRAMELSGAPRFTLHQGWFNETVPAFDPGEPIALLRLDGDWYDSTLVCLEHLFPRVASGGLLLVDDYYHWEGCARALHDFLSKEQRPERIRETAAGVCFLVKH